MREKHQCLPPARPYWGGSPQAGHVPYWELNQGSLGAWINSQSIELYWPGQGLQFYVV